MLRNLWFCSLVVLFFERIYINAVEFNYASLRELIKFFTDLVADMSKTSADFAVLFIPFI